MMIINKKDLFFNTKQDYVVLLKNIKNINIILNATEKNFDYQSMYYLNKTKKYNINENILDINCINIDDNNVIIECAQTSYQLYKDTSQKEYLCHILNGNYFSNHLSCGAFLKTTDNKYIFIKNKNGIKLFGGFFDFNKDKTVLDCISREILEELGKIIFQTVDMELLIFNKKYHYTGLIFNITTKSSSQDILQDFYPNQEVEDLLIIDNLDLLNKYELSPLLEIAINKN